MGRRLISLIVVVLALALVSPSPIKEKDIDDIIFRLAEMKAGIHLEGIYLQAIALQT